MRGASTSGDMHGERFAALDLLRGLAALAIVTRHFPWVGDAPIFLPRDYLGVDLFFMLSGFVVAHAYWPMLTKKEPDISGFLALRLIRLYPLYLLATLCGAALWLPYAIQNAVTPALFRSLAANLLFLPAGDTVAGLSDLPYPFVGPAWSLFWELAANALFALMAARLTPARLIKILIGSFVLLAASAFLHGSLDMGSTRGDFLGGGCRVAYSFFMGVALFRLRPLMPVRMAVPDWLIALIMLMTFVPGAMPAGGLYDLAIVTVLFPVLVLLGADAVSTGRSRRWGFWLGYCSYGVYVLQGPILGFLKYSSLVETNRPLVAFGDMGVTVLVATVLAASLVAGRLFDDPVRAWLRRKLLCSPYFLRNQKELGS